MQEAEKEIDPFDDETTSRAHFSSTMPVKPEGYYHNMDFSTFPLLLRVIYYEMSVYDTTFCRDIPFAMFQHAMTCLLYVSIVDYDWTENSESKSLGRRSPLDLIPSDFVIPGLIADYIASACNIHTTGDKVRFNLPKIAIPKSDTAGHCGAFGDVDAETHNGYECYVSPFVTWRLLERTIFCNKHDDQWGPWNPFAEDLLNNQVAGSPGYYNSPAGSKATPNLLGYQEPERLTPEALHLISGFTCSTRDDWSGMLRYSKELMVRVSKRLAQVRGIKFTKPKKIRRPAVSSDSIGIIRVTDVAYNERSMCAKM